MFVPFEQLLPNARIWVYQSDNILTPQQTTHIYEKTKIFMEQWTSHQYELKSSFCLFENKFLVIAIDETFKEASGCSIDKSIAYIKSLEETLSVNLMRRDQIAFLDENEQLQTILFPELKGLVTKGIVTEKTIVYDTTINSKKEFDQNFKVPIKQTWLKKYFN